MQFKDVIGQDSIKKRLIEGVHEQRISHAQLFCGPEGSGKLAMALAYAQYVNCTNRTETDSCGVCPSCHKYQKLAHPDLHFVYPVVKTKKFKDAVSDNFLDQWREQIAETPYFNLTDWYGRIGVENSQGQIYANESSEIIRKLNLKTFEAEYRVMIIWMAEAMNVQCANRLLKLIEEPPPKTLFILISEDEERLLQTIRSRTQLIKFKSIEPGPMIEALKSHAEVSNMNVEGIVHLSNGNFISAMRLLSPNDDEVYFFDKFTSIMRTAYKRDWTAMFDWSEELSSIGRERQKSFLLYSLKMLRENFIFNMKQPNIVYLNERESLFSSKFSPFINERNITVFFEEFERAYRDISQNGNSKIVFLDLSFKVTKMIRA